jgi:hypothetical protein
MLRIGVLRGTSSSSSSSSSRLSRMGYGTRQAVYDVVASVASTSARIAAAGGCSHAEQFSTGVQHDLLLLELALNVQAVHQKQRGRAQLPQVSAAVSAARQRNGSLTGQQQQQQQQQGASEVEPWHEQLLLAVGVPLDELKLAAGVTVKHADRYSTNSADGVVRALTNALSADAASLAAAALEAAATTRAAVVEQLTSGSSDYDKQHGIVGAVGGGDRLLAAPVVGALLELLLLTCSSPLSRGRSRQQTGTVRAQAAAMEARAANLHAAGLADAVLVNIKARVTIARISEAAAFGNDLLAQLAAAAALGATSNADLAADARPTPAAKQQRHQAAAAARMSVTALLGQMLQLGPALLHLERQCSVDTTAGPGDSGTSIVPGSLMYIYGGIISELASNTNEHLGTLTHLQQQSWLCYVCRIIVL